VTDRIRAVRGLTRRLVRLLPVVVGVVALTPAVASAQQVNITPASSITPDSTITSWIVLMGIATAILGVVIVLFLLFGYLRFAPKFFGREAPPKVAPGARPAFTGRTPVDQRAPVGAVRPFSRVPEEGAAEAASASAAQPAASASAVATLERPAAGGEGKPEPSQTGGTAEEPPPEEGSGGGGEDETPPTEYEQEMAEVEAEEAPEAPAAEAEAATGQAEAPAPADETPAAAPAAESTPAATSHGGSTMDQETFDRVLQEQLGKGVDRRVAEGRARAAAVVAARKKAQG
jgi:hypothetical protein